MFINAVFLEVHRSNKEQDVSEMLPGFIKDRLV
jgi:hypothetical protein